MRLSLLAAALLTTTTLAASPALAQEAAAPAPAPVGNPADIPAGKLPATVRPAAYRLDLTVDPARERFSGKVEIDATLAEPSARIYLHGRGLAMRTATATVGGRTFAGTWQQVEETGVAALTFAQPLPAGPVTFAFAYDAPFNDTLPGLYRIRVGGQWYAWTQFESIDARAAFPGFDEPGFKTPFTVTLRTPPGLMAISNAPEAGKTLEGGLEVHRFAPTLPLPTYLVALVVGPFTAVAGTVPPTPQRETPLPLRVVSTQPNAGKLDFALKGSEEIVRHLEAYFGQSFPFPKLDQITSPVMPGAMENAGADIYGDPILVMEEGAPVTQKRTFGMVVAHELAHQWFGDLVTPAWWDDIWLNESFANWMGFRIGNEWRPDLNIGAGAVEEGFAAMNIDALIAGRPIRQPITANHEIDAAFDTITYGKGGHVVAMIAAYMDDERFKAGVRRYMAAHRYGNATSNDFFRAMAEESGDPRILPAMQGFIDQQGVPLLTFKGGKGRYAVTQSRYVQLGTPAPATLWGVPMCARRGEARACRLIDGKTARFTIAGTGALMPNAGGQGYYRFELPRRDWDALIAGADRLSGSEALALADSLGASFRAGRSSVPQLAALARKLAANPDSYASGAALTTLSYLADRGVIGEAAKPAWRAFAARTHAPLLAALGFDPRAGAYAAEDPDRRQRRQQVVSVLAGTARDEAVTATLRQAAAAYLGGDAQALDPAWFDEAFAARVSAEGLPAARALVDRALASDDELLRGALLGAAGASGKDEIARWLLDDLADDRLRPSEKRNLLAMVLATPATRDFGYAWLEANLDTLMAKGGIFVTARLPQFVGGFCSVDRAEQIGQDLRPRLKNTPGELELERAIERVRNCGRLKDARGAEVTKAVLRLK